jgi:hypothetical protein
MSDCPITGTFMPDDYIDVGYDAETVETTQAQFDSIDSLSFSFVLDADW